MMSIDRPAERGPVAASGSDDLDLIQIWSDLDAGGDFAAEGPCAEVLEVGGW